MERMNIIGKALAARAAFVKIKSELGKADIDISDVKYITDLPPVLAGILPADLAEQASDLLKDEQTVTALLEAFTGAANLGGLVSALYRPTQDVEEDDLYA